MIVDSSKVGFGHQLLLVRIAYRKRAIPLAWTWIKSSRGHRSVQKQKALLSYVHSLIPAKSNVLLVGDAEFGAVGVLKLLRKWHWQYVLRQKGRYLLRQKGHRNFQRLDSFEQTRTDSVVGSLLVDHQICLHHQCSGLLEAG